MMRKPQPLFEGEGHFRFTGHEGPAQYSIEGDPSRLRLGPNRLRGRVRTTAELAERAFRAGEAVLMIEGGTKFRLTMLGYSAGQSDVFVEIRV